MTEHQVQPTEQAKTRRGIYLLPNLFTTAALFAGFYAIIAAMKGMYGDAAIAIFIAMLADGLDGRVARLTNTASAFGAEYDSLSDLVAFGVGPAVISYTYALISFGKLGWLMAFFYTAATALRLARFNVHVDDEDQDKAYFQGMPCPSAAAVVVSTMWLAHIYGLHGFFANIILAVVTMYVAIMMVSNIPFYSFKTFDFRGKVPFVAILVVVLIFMAISIDPPSVLFISFAAYAVSGPLLFLKRRFFRSRKNK